MITMKLNNEAFNLIKDGHKTIEARLNDEKRQLIEVDNEIEFTNTKTNELLKTKVVQLLLFKTFKELYASEDPYLFGGNNSQLLNESIYNFYNKDDELKHGVVGIRIILL